jgi:hypothetical protein
MNASELKMLHRNIQTRYIPDNSTIIDYPELKVTVVNYESVNHPAVLCYRGKQSKPVYNYRFETTEKRQNFIDRFLAEEKKVTDYKANQLQERKAALANVIDTVKVGDVYATCWGYDQTNVEFYQVIKIIGKRTVEVREIAQMHVEGSEGYDCCYVKPVLNDFLDDEESFRAKVGVDSIASRKIIGGTSASKYDLANEKGCYKSWYC